MTRHFFGPQIMIPIDRIIHYVNDALSSLRDFFDPPQGIIYMQCLKMPCLFLNTSHKTIF